MVVGAAGDDRKTRAMSRAHQGTRVGDDLTLVFLEFRLQRLEEPTALAAMTCMSGPPWVPGNTSELSFFAISSLGRARMRPPRGPRSVL